MINKELYVFEHVRNRHPTALLHVHGSARGHTHTQTHTHTTNLRAHAYKHKHTRSTNYCPRECCSSRVLVAHELWSLHFIRALHYFGVCLRLFFCRHSPCNLAARACACAMPTILSLPALWPALRICMQNERASEREGGSKGVREGWRDEVREFVNISREGRRSASRSSQSVAAHILHQR